jgi:hypothetical protein
MPSILKTAISLHHIVGISQREIEILKEERCRESLIFVISIY